MPGTPRTPRNKGGESGKKPPTPRTSSPLPSVSGNLSNTPARPGTSGLGLGSNVTAQPRASPTPRTLGQCVDAYLSQMDPANGTAVLDRLMRDFDPQYNLFSQQLNLVRVEVERSKWKQNSLAPQLVCFTRRKRAPSPCLDRT